MIARLEPGLNSRESSAEEESEISGLSRCHPLSVPIGFDAISIW